MADIVPPAFAEWFAKNYPSDTIIFDPAWHVGPIFRAACWHYNDALSAGKDAEIERLRAALVDCRVELDDYYMREYRSDDPIIQQRLEEKMASNPARVVLEVK